MLDGQFKRITEADDLEPGMVVREMHDDATVPPFGDSVVLKRIDNKEWGKTCFVIARPYVFASSTQTTCPVPLLGCETFEILFDGLRDRYVLILNSRGIPFKHTT